MNFDADLQDRLQKAFDEIVKLKKENFEESCQRQQVEKELLLVRKKVNFFCIFLFSLSSLMYVFNSHSSMETHYSVMSKLLLHY